MSIVCTIQSVLFPQTVKSCLEVVITRVGTTSPTADSLGYSALGGLVGLKTDGSIAKLDCNVSTNACVLSFAF